MILRFFWWLAIFAALAFIFLLVLPFVALVLFLAIPLIFIGILVA